MRLFKHKGITPEVLAAIYNSKTARDLFRDISLPILKDYKIRIVVIYCVIMWAFAMAITISIGG